MGTPGNFCAGSVLRTNSLVYILRWRWRWLGLFFQLFLTVLALSARKAVALVSATQATPSLSKQNKIMPTKRLLARTHTHTQTLLQCE